MLDIRARTCNLLKQLSVEPDLYQFEALASQSGVIHAVTGRRGGVSPVPYDSLNLGYGVPDDPGNVSRNRRRVAEALGISIDRIVTTKQVHGNACAVVTKADAGRGALDRATAFDGFDNLVTKEPGVYLWMSFADCVPVLLYDPDSPAIGISHSGWRGTLAGAAGSAIRTMIDEGMASPAGLSAFIGPSIGPCCYEVGPEVWQLFAERWPTSLNEARRPGNRRLLDLWTAIRVSLIDAGLSPEKIHCAETCTADNRDRFFSHRGDRGRSGRFAVIAGLTDE